MQHPRSPLLVLSIASLVVAAALYASLSVLSDPFAVEFAKVTSTLFAVVPCAFLIWVLVRRWALAPTVPPVDIWEHQRYAMHISDQMLPKTPTLTDASVLYWALTAEEMAETGMEMKRVLDRAMATRTVNTALMLALGEASQGMARHAKRIREALAAVPNGFAIPLTVHEAVEILDGTTDMTVTVAGLPLATGLPGPAAYMEVQESNISKRNPITCRIEKDASGKWIKGANYTAPNLYSVLAQVATPDHRVVDK